MIINNRGVPFRILHFPRIGTVLVRYVSSHNNQLRVKPAVVRSRVGRSGVGYKLAVYAPRMEAWKAMRGCEGAALRVLPATKDCMAVPCHDVYLVDGSSVY